MCACHLGCWIACGCSCHRSPFAEVSVTLRMRKPREVIGALRDAAENNGVPALAEIADQIEAQTKPARIPEPALWGVVEATVEGIPRRRWVHHEEQRWVCDTGERRDWEDLRDPELVREGVTA